MKRAVVVVFAACLSVVAGNVESGRSNVQFSAETVQSSPNNKLRHAQVFVGDNQVRLEYQKDNQVAVNIYDMKNGRAIFLLPEKKAYMVRQVSQDQLGNPMLPPGDMDPCAYVTNADCRQLASETLYGRPVVQWEMTLPGVDNTTVQSQLWIDTERRMPLKQIWSDGATFELRLVGTEVLHGRSTERWVSTRTGPDEKSMKSLQWYDPELQLVVREELPGGFFRELRNVRVGVQDDSLFTVPAGYQPVTPERGEEEPASQGQGQSANQYPGNAR